MSKEHKKYSVAWYGIIRSLERPLRPREPGRTLLGERKTCDLTFTCNKVAKAIWHLIWHLCKNKPRKQIWSPRLRYQFCFKLVTFQMAVKSVTHVSNVVGMSFGALCNKITRETKFISPNIALSTTITCKLLTCYSRFWSRSINLQFVFYQI